MCQHFFDMILHPVHEKFSKTYLVHYIDVILLACFMDKKSQCLYEYIITCLPATGLKIATEKNSDSAPISNLGYVL